MNRIEAISRLKIFNENVETLDTYSLTRSKQNSVTISAKKGGPVNVIRRGPDEESISAAVLLARCLIQNNDTSIGTLARIYGDKSLPISQRHRGEFQFLRDGLNNYLDTVTPFQYNLVKYTNRDILNIFTYGQYAHKKGNHREIHQRWRRIIPLYRLVQSNYIEILQILIGVATGISKINQLVIRTLETAPQERSILIKHK